MSSKVDLENRLVAHLADDTAVSPSRLASDWGVHVHTVYRDIRKGNLQAFRLPNGCLAIPIEAARSYGVPIIPQPVPPRPPTPVEVWRRTELAEAFTRAHGRCQLCGEPVDLAVQSGRTQATLDHILPQARGGGHHRENLQLAHRGCNSRKRDSESFTPASAH
jgi:5-methylcytosine-specific restriction endonuclease McrA